MMMNHLLRRSASIASPASRQALAVLFSAESFRFFPATPLLHHEAFHSLARPDVQLPAAASSKVLGRSAFHSSTAVGFRVSDVMRAQNAVADFAYEEKSHGKSEDEGLEISKLGISDVIVTELAKKGITKLFPIQRAVLEPAMQGRDMIGRAKTGTGKTLAFGIPIMDKIIKFNEKNGRGRNPLALVLAPTRELARQVEKEFRESSDLDTICVYGGSPMSQQMRTLEYGVDLVVGTPGRLIDLLKRGALNLSEVQFVVLDEADQMLAVGFAEDVEIILEKLPAKRQSMMFSATMPSWIKQITRKYLNEPLTIDLVGDSDQKLAEGITLYSVASDNYGKASIIAPLVTEHANGGKCIVFTQTKRDADRLAYSLNATLKCEPLHGDISQAQRERTLSSFRDGRFNVLVATDVAARGLDIPNVDLVIHYELPNNAEIFVHRSGRTGRAGKKGSAILIYTDNQTRDVRMIEQHVGSKFKELPRIKVEAGTGVDMFGGMGGSRFGDMGGSRFGGTGRSRMGGSGFGSSSSYGGSGFSRSGGFGSPSGRTGGYGDSGSRRSDGFEGSGSGRSGGFGSPGRSGGFGNSGRSGGFGNSGRSGGYGDSGRSGGFGNSGANRSSGFGNSSSGSFGGSSSSRFSFED